MKDSKSYNKLKIIVIGITIISKILGFSRDLVLSYCYGATNISDAYLIATTLPVTLFAFVGTAITSSYIPVANGLKDENSRNRFDSLLFTFLTLICSIIIIVVNLFPSYIIKIFASGFEGEVLDISISILRVNIFNVLFSGIIFLFVAFLNFKQKFIVAIARSIPFDIAIIGSIILSYKTSNINILSFGLIISIILELLFILPAVVKNDFKLTKFRKSDFSGFKEMLIIALPAILSSALSEVNAVIDRSIASNIAEGAVSSLTYSSRVISALTSIFITSLITIMYPKLVKSLDGEDDSFANYVTKTANDINFFTVPIFASILIFSNLIINVLFGRGNFSTSAEQTTSTTFLMYSISFIFCGLRELFTMTFYAQKKIKIPIIISVVALSLNIILNFILSKFMGVSGLALATSISNIVSALIMLVLLLKKKNINIKLFSTNFAKIVISTVIMSVVLIISKHLLSSFIANNILLLTTCILLGLMIYLLSNIVLKTDFVMSYANKFKKRKEY